MSEDHLISADPSPQRQDSPLSGAIYEQSVENYILGPETPGENNQDLIDVRKAKHKKKLYSSYNSVRKRTADHLHTNSLIPKSAYRQ